MPAGVEVLVEDGFATIDFVDPSKRGPALAALLAVGGPELIETMTRTGPRTLYRVPEGNAREAGLIDAPAPAPVQAKPGTAARKPSKTSTKPAPEPMHPADLLSAAASENETDRREAPDS